ncbi:MAG: glycosyltransferase 87 family protein [Vicinamibacterales bacterium]
MTAHTSAGSAGSPPFVRLAGVLLVTVLIAAALSIDVPRTAYKIKSDEATYVAMTLSVAFDHDFAYERRDLERFWKLYEQGPEGIFLKRGKHLGASVDARPPFVHLETANDSRGDRLYFGKSMTYAVVAAPLVRLFGLNGFYVLHVLLLALVGACGYTFLSATSEPGPALAFTLAFVAASAMLIYGVFLMPDLLNAALVFVAYFLWLYKESRLPRWRICGGDISDLLAAGLLAAATYSKPTNAPLIAPLVLLLAFRQRWRHACVTGTVFVVATGLLFGLNAAVSGEFNYQGGDRKTFYGSFPFETSRDVWAEKTDLASTNNADTENVLETSGLASRFLHNVEYFMVGRHFGFVPYYFPGVVALLALALSRRRFESHRVLVVGGAVVAVVVLLLFLPYTWSGGGGPPGNRYFLSIYPVLFFVIPKVSTWHVVLAWVGGALFTAKILVSPFALARNTWEIAEHGFARYLPVELTMSNDLPLMLAQPPRGRIPYRVGSEVFLYFLDGNAYPPEPVDTRADGSVVYGMWVSGHGRADILVRTDYPVQALAFEASSPIRTRLVVSVGGPSVAVAIEAGKTAVFTVPVRGVPGWHDFNYLMSARSEEGFVPRLIDPSSGDSRNLGVNVRFRPIGSQEGAR